VGVGVRVEVCRREDGPPSPAANESGEYE
jgi:hypothetical protein